MTQHSQKEVQMTEGWSGVRSGVGVRMRGLEIGALTKKWESQVTQLQFFLWNEGIN